MYSGTIIEKLAKKIQDFSKIKQEVILEQPPEYTIID